MLPALIDKIAWFGFSALQRAENSSISVWTNARRGEVSVSVLFSEPKIPQCATARGDRDVQTHVSVLFSEPKIPQSQTRSEATLPNVGFSALQRADNSSIADPRPARFAVPLFQCSSASRKFLNRPSTHRT